MAPQDDYYSNYFEDVNYRGLTGVFMRFLWNFMERPYKGKHFENVLEIGATHLEHLRFVQHSYKNYIASDIEVFPLHPFASLIIKNLPTTQNVIQDIADAHDLKYLDNTYDRVIVTCLLHHLSFPEKAMSEMLRVTKPGGVVSIFLPNDPGMVYRIVRYWTTHKRSRNLERKKRIGNHLFLWATEHRNHVFGLTIMLREIFKNEQIRVRRFPPLIKSWNLGFFTIYEIEKKSNA